MNMSKDEWFEVVVGLDGEPYRCGVKPEFQAEYDSWLEDVYAEIEEAIPIK